MTFNKAVCPLSAVICLFLQEFWFDRYFAVSIVTDVCFINHGTAHISVSPWLGVLFHGTLDVAGDWRMTVVLETHCWDFECTYRQAMGFETGSETCWGLVCNFWGSQKIWGSRAVQDWILQNEVCQGSRFGPRFIYVHFWPCKIPQAFLLSKTSMSTCKIWAFTRFVGYHVILWLVVPHASLWGVIDQFRDSLSKPGLLHCSDSLLLLLLNPYRWHRGWLRWYTIVLFPGDHSVGSCFIRVCVVEEAVIKFSDWCYSIWVNSFSRTITLTIYHMRMSVNRSGPDNRFSFRSTTVSSQAWRRKLRGCPDWVEGIDISPLFLLTCMIQVWYP